VKSGPGVLFVGRFPIVNLIYLMTRGLSKFFTSLFVIIGKVVFPHCPFDVCRICRNSPSFIPILVICVCRLGNQILKLLKPQGGRNLDLWITFWHKAAN
jgi:hypothetical protein